MRMYLYAHLCSCNGMVICRNVHAEIRSCRGTFIQRNIHAVFMFMHRYFQADVHSTHWRSAQVLLVSCAYTIMHMHYHYMLVRAQVRSCRGTFMYMFFHAQVRSCTFMHRNVHAYVRLCTFDDYFLNFWAFWFFQNFVSGLADFFFVLAD